MSTKYRKRLFPIFILKKGYDKMVLNVERKPPLKQHFLRKLKMSEWIKTRYQRIPFIRIF